MKNTIQQPLKRKLTGPIDKRMKFYWARSHFLLFYCNCSKFSNTFLLLNKMLVIRAEINKALVRIANGADPDQTASSEAV